MLALVVVLSGCSDSDSDPDGAAGGTDAGTSVSSSSPSSTPPSPTPPSAAPYSSSPSGWSASAPVVYRPPYIERVAWTETEVGPSLSVFPTTSGRYTSDDGAMAAAWAEVLALDSGAATPGMQAQFDCHWRFARLVDPEKTSWNLEPGRPVVTEEVMIETRCNPGFAEE